MSNQEAIESLKALSKMFEEVPTGAIAKAIYALEQQTNDGWIPVTERLPNEEECRIYLKNDHRNRRFICTIKIGEYEAQTRELYFSEIFGWKYGPEDYNRHVIAWRLQPEPWKE
jgi:hypothetical protein